MSAVKLVRVATQAQQLRIVGELSNVLGAAGLGCRHGSVGTGAVGLKLQQEQGDVESALAQRDISGGRKALADRSLTAPTIEILLTTCDSQKQVCYYPPARKHYTNAGEIKASK